MKFISRRKPRQIYDSVTNRVSKAVDSPAKSITIYNSEPWKETSVFTERLTVTSQRTRFQISRLMVNEKK